MTSPHLTTPHPPALPPLGSFQKCLVSFAVMDFQLWCKSFQDWHISSRRHSVSILYISVSMWCARINNSVTSIPSLSGSRPSLYSLFFVFSPTAWSGGTKWKIQVRQAGRRPSSHSFQLWMKGAGMWNGISVIDLQVIVTLTATPDLLLVIGRFRESVHRCFLNVKAIKLRINDNTCKWQYKF